MGRTSSGYVFGGNTRLYTSGWSGNQYFNARPFNTQALARYAGIAGRVTGVAGVAGDVYNLAANPNRDAIDYGTTGVNAAMTAVGIWGGPAGAIAAGVYFAGYYGVEYFYDGGVRGLIQDVTE